MDNKYIKSYNQYVNENYKVDNAKRVLTKVDSDRWNSYEQDQHNAENHPLRNAFMEAVERYSKNEVVGSKTIYIRPMINLGDIDGYKNAHLDHIRLNTSDELSFWLKFDVENPRQAEVDRLQAAFDQKYKNLSSEEFSAVQADWDKDYEQIRSINVHIPDFTYVYIFEIPTEKLQEILAKLNDPETIELTDKINAAYKAKHSQQFKLNSIQDPAERFEAQKQYWKMLDDYEDLTATSAPSEAELAARAKKYAKTKEEYDRENQEMNDIINSLDFD